MKKLHIQVDNLCQFLPQEKVAEFTNMSKCDLLENTEKCVRIFVCFSISICEKQVGGEELYSLHKSLKTLGQETRSLEVDLNEALHQSATSKQILKHLEPDVQAIQGRKDLEGKIAEYTQCKYFRVKKQNLFKIYHLQNFSNSNRITKKKLSNMKKSLKYLILSRKKSMKSIID